MGAKTTSEPTGSSGNCTGELSFPATHDDIHVLENLAQTAQCCSLASYCVLSLYFHGIQVCNIGLLGCQACS